MTSKIALVTDSTFPQLTDDDRPLVGALAKLGIEAFPLVWTADAPIPDDADALVLRSTFDYYQRPGRFIRWLDAAARSGLALWNPPNVAKWNLDKSYLRSVEGLGFAVTPTEWIRGGAPKAIAAAAALRGWDEAIAKPAISAGADRTVAFNAAGGTAKLADIFADFPEDGTVLVQPRLREIETEGEWSLIFFEGALSHTVLKRPSRGDFRVQIHHGGSVEAAVPPPGAVSMAERLLRALGFPLLYARVDLVRQGNEFLLMELELLEPMLYFGWDEGAVDRFAAAIAHKLVPRRLPA